MNRNPQTSLKKVAALLLSLMLIAAQLVAPVTALAMENSKLPVENLPIVTLYYQLSGEELPQPLQVLASPTSLTPVYWAMLPEQAFGFPIAIDVSAINMELPYTYAPVSGTPIAGVNAAGFDAQYTPIDIYQDGVLLATYPLYLSSVEMPLEEPPIAQNGFLHIEYINSQTNEPFYKEDREFAPGVYTIGADKAQDFPSYALNEGTEPIDVTIFDDGTASVEAAIFWFTPLQPEPPVEPDKPIEPDQPSEPDQPTEPDQPAEPDQPSEPDQPTVPDQPSEPDQPIEPDQPVLAPINLYGETTAVVHFREGPGKNYPKVFENVKSGKLIWIYGVVTVDGADWLSIRYVDQNADCYVSSDFVARYTQEESDAITNASSEPVPVPVSYVDKQTGIPFFQEAVSCPVGKQTTIYIREDVAAGYTLQGDASVVVNVSSSRVPDPQSVTFLFQKKQVTGSVYTSYVTSTEEFANETLTFAPGEYPIAPNA
ncbi:MAG: hypothetical protein RSB91_04355, partial [Clostridia bacterium]